MKAMATTSISSSFCEIILKNKAENVGGMRFDLHPADALPDSIVVASGGCLLDTAHYDISISLPSDFMPLHVDISVNGGDVATFELSKGEPNSNRLGMTTYALVNGRSETGSSADVRLFLLTYGFARIEVDIAGEGLEGPVALSTKDIPCRSCSSIETDNIEEMLIQLLDSDNKASEWMFSHYAASQQAPYSILEGSTQDHSPRSLSTTLHLIKKVLAEYALQREHFRSHGYMRIVKARKTVPFYRVRRAGYEELDWLSKNLSIMSEVPEGKGISMHGRSYLPQKVQTEMKIKSHDSYENRLVLGFLSEVVGMAKLLHESLRGGCDAIGELERTLEGFRAEGMAIPSLALVRSLSLRENACLSQLNDLIAAGSELLRDYKSFLPDVDCYFTRTPHRTKIFQEVQAYSRIFALLLEWINFGDFSIAKEGLALHLLRADKLYEYYSLYRMLSWLADKGYVPSKEEDHPVRCGDYLPLWKYRPESQIASIFSLCNGKSRVKLYYQPIIHANLDEEEGICLHRLSGDRRMFWTPDYLIEVTTESNQKSFHVIDAKYRPAQDLHDSFSKPSELSICIMKYMHDIAGKNGKRVSSVWLAAGRQKGKDLHYAENSIWYQENRSEFGARSGVFVLNPKVSRLDEVFREIIPQAANTVQVSDQLDLNAETYEPQDRPERIEETASFSQTRATSASGAVDGLKEFSTKKNVSQQKHPSHSHERRESANFDDTVRGCIEDVVRGVADTSDLFDSRWSHSNFRLDRPLLRKNKPDGREANYYSVLEVDGDIHWAFCKWRPHQKTLLTRFANKLRKDAVSR